VNRQRVGSLRYNEPVKACVFAVEDDPDIARLVRHHLEVAGFGVRSFASSQRVVSDAEKNGPALFLLDIMIPGEDGLQLCRKIRAHPKLAGVPIIFLTAKGTESDRVMGLELGADDYITKPFSPKELVARVRAVLRRFERPISRDKAPERIVLGDLEIDNASVAVRLDGKPISTTATEFRLLDYLASHPGRVFTRDNLLDAVWRDTSFVTPRSVDVYVRRLREKIERDPEDPQYIRTVRGVGYKFEAPK